MGWALLVIIPKIYWWQDGGHLKPETGEERQALLVLTTSLKFTDLREQPMTNRESRES